MSLERSSRWQGESYASDVDANYDGKVSVDSSVLEKDWGKSQTPVKSRSWVPERHSLGKVWMVTGRGITRASSEKMQ